VSLEGLRSLPGVPATTSPSSVQRIMFSGARSSYDTPDGLMTKRSSPGSPPSRTRPDTLPPVHHEAVTDQLSVQTCDIGANAGDRGLRLGVVSGTDPLMISSFR
jgi:hypothetical protein